MLYAPRAICLHANSDNQHLTSRLITPQNLGQQIKPFISLEVFRAGESSTTDEFLMSSNSGTAMITFLLSGEADYRDSTHNNGTLKKHDLLWMLSGSGIWHSLKPKTLDCISVRLWVALSPALESAPAQSIYLESNLVERDGPAQVLLGRHGDARSGFALPALINYLVITLSAGQEWSYEPPVNHRIAWIAAISGKIKTSNILVSPEEIVIYENSHKSITFFAEEDCMFLLGSSVEYTHDLAFEKYPTHTANEAFINAASENSIAFKEFMYE